MKRENGGQANRTDKTCMDLKEKLNVLEQVLPWARLRRSSFPIWELDEIVNEAYMHGLKLYEKWDRNKASFAALLRSSLYDHVFRSYAKQNDIQLIRRRAEGGRAKREYKGRGVYYEDMVRLEEILNDKGRLLQEKDEGGPNVSWSLMKHTPRAVAYLLAKGLKKSEGGRSIGVSGARISQLVLELKKIMEEEPDER